MAIKDTIPCNTDLLQSSKFILSFPRIIATQFFCQAVNIPGVQSGNPNQTNPFKDLNIPGDKLVYEDLIVQFLVPEDLSSWTIVYDWMRGIAFPHEFEEYKQLATQTRYSSNVSRPQYADAQLTILSTVNKELITFQFKDCFPTALSGIQLDIREGSARTITAMATFKYAYYDIKPI